MAERTNGFQEVIDDGESLKLFVAKMAQFDSAFCEAMIRGCDFTLRLEVHGNKGEVLHVRLYSDDIARPKGKKKRVKAEQPRKAG